MIASGNAKTAMFMRRQMVRALVPLVRNTRMRIPTLIQRRLATHHWPHTNQRRQQVQRPIGDDSACPRTTRQALLVRAASLQGVGIITDDRSVNLNSAVLDNYDLRITV